MRYDVYHTTEVNLRDTTATFLNKLIKRVQKKSYFYFSSNIFYYTVNRQQNGCNTALIADIQLVGLLRAISFADR